jgi:hypothetical protein
VADTIVLESRTLKFREERTLRGPEYVCKRAATLLGRYGLTASRAADRVVESVEWLAEIGCAPTFPVMVREVRRHPLFFRTLEEVGLEVSLHDHDHIALVVGIEPVEDVKASTRLIGVLGADIRRTGLVVPATDCSP